MFSVRFVPQCFMWSLWMELFKEFSDWCCWGSRMGLILYFVDGSWLIKFTFKLMFVIGAWGWAALIIEHEITTCKMSQFIWLLKFHGIPVLGTQSLVVVWADVVSALTEYDRRETLQKWMQIFMTCLWTVVDAVKGKVQEAVGIRKRWGEESLDWGYREGLSEEMDFQIGAEREGWRAFRWWKMGSEALEWGSAVNGRLMGILVINDLNQVIAS